MRKTATDRRRKHDGFTATHTFVASPVSTHSPTQKSGYVLYHRPDGRQRTFPAWLAPRSHSLDIWAKWTISG
ncbi:hypothetical protein HYDPIDRAFT_110785 [Hydnomerulius pinastri MD-312]|nr:hypothetical protein HYDPIDRAFT_110785 [Hydnomerulius pinastri MD-312]